MQPNLPTFSVVIPTINRHRSLERCLDGLLDQAYPSTYYEVIVVNDGGHRIPRDISPGLQKKVSFQVIHQSNRGPGSARNTGVRAAQGKFLAFTDDDCLADTNWLATLQASLQETEPCAVGGCTLNALVENPYSTASQILIDYLYEYYHLSPGKKAQAPFFSSNNLGISREVFLDLGGFDQRLRTAEDRDLCARLIEANVALRYAPNARVHHYHDLDLKSYLVQHFHYGRGNYGYHRTRLLRGRGNYRLEPIAFYTGMLEYPFSKMSGGRAVWQSALLMLSQFGNISGFVTQALYKAFHP